MPEIMTRYAIAGNVFELELAAAEVEGFTRLALVFVDEPELPTGVFVAPLVGVALLLLFIELVVSVAEAYALPIGGVVTSGAATPKPAETVAKEGTAVERAFSSGGSQDAPVGSPHVMRTLGRPV